MSIWAKLLHFEDPKPSRHEKERMGLYCGKDIRQVSLAIHTSNETLVSFMCWGAPPPQPHPLHPGAFPLPLSSRDPHTPLM